MRCFVGSDSGNKCCPNLSTTQPSSISITNPPVLVIINPVLLFSVTLHDIVHTDKSLTLVFEYLERDLKQYMDDCGAILAMNNVKLFLFQVTHSNQLKSNDSGPGLS